MTTHDLLQEFSELDEDLIMEPRKFVSTRLNLLLGILAANLAAILPLEGFPSILAFLLIFGALCAAAMKIINRKKGKKLLIETGKPAPLPEAGSPPPPASSKKGG